MYIAIYQANQVRIFPLELVSLTFGLCHAKRPPNALGTIRVKLKIMKQICDKVVKK